MKKLFTALSIAAAFWANAQINLSLDTSFGTNGTISIPLVAEADFAQLLQAQDNSFILYGQDVPSTISIHQNKVFKIKPDGTLDTSFDNDGTLILPDYKGSFKVYKQGTDKLIVVFDAINSNYHSTTPYNDEKAILRYNLNGTLDTTFGTNGEIRIPFAGGEAYLGNNIAILTDGSILFADTQKYLKFTPNGTADTSFGSNGQLAVNNSGNIQLTSNGIINFYNDKIEKAMNNLTLDNSFGNNGVYNYGATGNYYPQVNLNQTISSLNFDNYEYFQLSEQEKMQ